MHLLLLRHYKGTNNASHERAEILLGDTTIIEVDLYNN
jgi:hypothetical protein